MLCLALSSPFCLSCDPSWSFVFHDKIFGQGLSFNSFHPSYFFLSIVFVHHIFKSILFILHLFLCSTMHLPLRFPLVCDRLLLVYLLQAKMLQAVHSHTFLTSDPLSLSLFYLKSLWFQLANSRLVLPPPPAPCPCSVLF